MLYNPIDAVQSQIADQWLQEWQMQPSSWDLCLSLCMDKEKRYYTIFAMNSMVG